MLELALKDWHADPQSREQAQSLLTEVQEQRRRAAHAGEACPQCGVWELIAHFWLGRNVQPEFENLVKVTAEADRKALVQLVYGQLLLSRKLSGADDYLQRGFLLATPFLEAGAYFQVMKRHALLTTLPLSHQPAPPASLQTLETEARVIQKFRGQTRPPQSGDGKDTLG